MKKILAFILLLLFIVLAWFSWEWYKENIACCDVKEAVESVEPTKEPVVKKFGPLLFNWDSNEATTNDLWREAKNEILAGKAEGKLLRIVGPYYKEEVNNSSFENIGFARANVVRNLLAADIDTTQIEIGARLIGDSDIAKTEPFGGTQFNWVIRNENIQEVDNKALIYFPYNSSTKLENTNINTYLKNVAESVKKSGKSISLTGFTDNKGRPSYNVKLGKQRASTLKKILVNLGVAADRISVNSKGEAGPIATNDTEAGRQKNRRVELEIN